MLEESKSGLLGKAKKDVFTDHSFRYELVMMLWVWETAVYFSISHSHKQTYAHCIINYSSELVKSAGEMNVTDKVKEAAVLLRKAAGVLDFISRDNSLRNNIFLFHNPSLKDFPEMSYHTANALSRYVVIMFKKMVESFDLQLLFVAGTCDCFSSSSSNSKVL